MSKEVPPIPDLVQGMKNYYPEYKTSVDNRHGGKSFICRKSSNIWKKTPLVII
jgi:hypothetical protein